MYNYGGIGGATYTMADPLVATNLTVSDGTLDVSTNNYAITVSGNYVNNAGFNGRGGTIT